MASSRAWRNYFENNARTLMAIPWDRGAELTDEEKGDVVRSIREFQLGESSEGRHLFRYAKEHAERTGDPDYLEAVRLFIAEEQRHGRDLGRFLAMNGITLAKSTWVDAVFRRLRNVFGNLETSIAVLITAEILAEVYYEALREATTSVILRILCDQILRDEKQHVAFQAERLAILRSGRGRLAQSLTMAAQRFLFAGTTILVGWTHRRTIRRGGISLWEWNRRCWREFEVAFAGAAAPAVAPAQ